MKLNYFSLKISLAAILLLIIFIYGDLLAQPKGRLRGRVTDNESGKPMPGVNILLPGTYHGAASDLDGKFTIRGISAGVFTVRFQFIGYTTVEVTGVKITAGLTETLNAEMNQTVLAAGQEIVVIGKRALFDIEETASRRSISADEIANSVVENVQDIVGNQVGVVKMDDEIHIRGGRSYENAYLLDGISVQDPLAGTGFGLQLSANAIEEIEIITGGFNAEFGQAMSGIINVKTKQGTDLYHGSVSYKTDNFGLYDEKSQFNFNTDVVELSIDGPDPFFGVLFPMLGFDLPGKQTFFANTYMFISDNFTKKSADTLRSSIYHGRKYAPRQSNNWSSMLKYTWTITPKHKLQYSYNASASINQNSQSLQSNLEFVEPGPGYPYRFQNNLNNANIYTHLNRQMGLGWTHTLSSRTFYEVKFSNFFSNLRSDVNGKLWNEFVEPKDIVTFPVEYQDTDTNKIVLVFPGDGFYDFGNGQNWHDHWVDEYTFKADITHQKNERQEIKAGVEISYQEMQLFDILNPWEGPLGKNNDFYKVYPSFGGIYIQEKLVMQGLVANIGLRFDYWFPGKYVEDAVADTNIVTISAGTRAAFENDTFGLFGRRWKGRISPRLGISHPVSDKQVLFFSYGHFSKRPKPQFVYAKLGKVSSKTSSPIFGNPNLDPETTVSYELGVKNRFTEDDVLTITAFYKDIFDYITTVPVPGTGRFRGQTFITYLNLDYSRIRGIEVEYRTRAGTRLSGSLNGSYSIATGKSSSPDDAALVQRGDRPERRITEDFLIWDRPWDGSLNLNYRISEGNSPKLFGITLPDKWNVNFRYFAQAGKRYRPIVDTGDTLSNGRPQYTRDTDGDGYNDDVYANVAEHWAWANLNISKWFNVGEKEFSVFLEVLNLFNRKNSNIINPVTGRAYEFGDPTPSGWNDPLFPATQAPVKPFPFNPARYLTQRNLKLGVDIVW